MSKIKGKGGNRVCTYKSPNQINLSHKYLLKQACKVSQKIIEFLSTWELTTKNTGGKMGGFPHLNLKCIIIALFDLVKKKPTLYVK